MTKPRKTSPGHKDQKKEVIEDILTEHGLEAPPLLLEELLKALEEKNDTKQQLMTECGYVAVPFNEDNLSKLIESTSNTSQKIRQDLIASHIEGENPWLGESKDPLFGQGEIILQYLVKTLRGKSPLSKNFRKFLANSFKKILDGEKADTVFKLNRHPGTTAKPETAIRDLFLYNMVLSNMNRDMRYGPAINKVYEELRSTGEIISYDMVENAYKKLNKLDKTPDK